MGNPKRKTITELRSSLFDTFDEVVSGEVQYITHKNGSMIAMVPVNEIEKLQAEIDLHKNLAIGFAQAMRGDGVDSQTLKKRLKKREKELRAVHG